jgi:hypothetical protein
MLYAYVPKLTFLPMFLQAEERHIDILGRLLYTAKLVAKQEGLDDGYRVVINDGPKGCKYYSPCQHLNFDEYHQFYFELLILE